MIGFLPGTSLCITPLLIRTEKEIMTNVDYNGAFYTVTDSAGNTYTFDSEDKDLAYIDGFLEALSIWRDYVVAEKSDD